MNTVLSSAIFYSMIIGMFSAIWELYKKKIETAKSLKQEMLTLTVVLVIFSIGVRINPWFGAPFFMFIFLKIIQKFDEFRMFKKSKIKKIPRLTKEKLELIITSIKGKMEKGGIGYGGKSGGEGEQG